jgi:hypothetical protein
MIAPNDNMISHITIMIEIIDVWRIGDMAPTGNKVGRGPGKGRIKAR